MWLQRKAVMGWGSFPTGADGLSAVFYATRVTDLYL